MKQYISIISMVLLLSPAVMATGKDLSWYEANKSDPLVVLEIEELKPNQRTIESRFKKLMHRYNGRIHGLNATENDRTMGRIITEAKERLLAAFPQGEQKVKRALKNAMLDLDSELAKFYLSDPEKFSTKFTLLNDSFKSAGEYEANLMGSGYIPNQLFRDTGEALPLWVLSNLDRLQGDLMFLELVLSSDYFLLQSGYPKYNNYLLTLYRRLLEYGHGTRLNAFSPTERAFVERLELAIMLRISYQGMQPFSGLSSSAIFETIRSSLFLIDFGTQGEEGNRAKLVEAKKSAKKFMKERIVALQSQPELIVAVSKAMNLGGPELSQTALLLSYFGAQSSASASHASLQEHMKEFKSFVKTNGDGADLLKIAQLIESQNVYIEKPQVFKSWVLSQKVRGQCKKVFRLFSR